jgi:hypothetical protein
LSLIGNEFLVSFNEEYVNVAFLFKGGLVFFDLNGEKWTPKAFSMGAQRQPMPRGSKRNKFFTSVSVGVFITYLLISDDIGCGQVQ